MKAIITSKKVFTSKKGVVWHNMSYVLLPSGEAGTFMMDGATYEAQSVDLPDVVVYSNATEVDLEFDNNKRVVSLSS